MHNKRTGVISVCILLSFLLYGCGFFNTQKDVPDLEEQPPAFSQNDDDSSNVAEAPGQDLDENKYSNLDITEKTLEIPGIIGDYSFLFLSDTHIIALDGSEEEQVTENALPRTELFKDSQGIMSYENFPVWGEYAYETDMDMILLGGDIIDFPSEANLKLLTENLENLQTPYAYTLGNHDWTYPWEYMTAMGREQYRPLLAPFTEENPAAHIIEYEELVILCVDNSSNQVEAEALPVMEEALSTGKPVIVMLHVPFSTETLLEQAASVWSSPVSIGMADKGGIYPDANTLAFQEKILAENSPVVCVLAGHVHFSDESMLTDSIVQFVTGAGYLNEGIVLRIHGHTLPQNNINQRQCQSDTEH